MYFNCFSSTTAIALNEISSNSQKTHSPEISRTEKLVKPGLAIRGARGTRSGLIVRPGGDAPCRPENFRKFAKCS